MEILEKALLPLCLCKEINCKCISKFRSLSLNAQGWIVCTFVLIQTVVRSGITYSFGMFAVKLKEDYQVGMSLQNWIGTLSFCVSLTCAPLSILFIRKFGAQGYQLVNVIGILLLSGSAMLSSFVSHEAWMLLSHSLLYGLGSSLTLMSTSLLIVEYFDKYHRHHVLATSILLSGYPLASVLFNPINAWIISSYGWRFCFRINSSLIFVIGMLCGLFMVPPLDEVIMETVSWHDDFKKRMFSACDLKVIHGRPQIIPWMLGSMLVYIGFYMPFVNLPSYFDLEGVTIGMSSVGLLILSLCEFVSYIIASFCGDLMKHRLVYMNIIAALGLSIVWFLLPNMQTTFNGKLFFCGLIGALISLSIVYQYPASAEVTRLPMDTAWSATNVWSGLGILLGPLFSGVVYDMRKSYQDVFIIFGVLYLVQALTFVSIPLLQICFPDSTADYEELNGASAGFVLPNSATQQPMIPDVEAYVSVATSDCHFSSTPQNIQLPLSSFRERNIDFATRRSADE